MSLITIMGDIPLYSTIEEAEAWGSTFGIQSYHTHVFQGQTGYMSGESHADIELTLESFNINTGSYVGSYTDTDTVDDDVDTTDTSTQTSTLPPTPPPLPPPPPPPPPMSTPTTTGGGGGGGY